MPSALADPELHAALAAGMHYWTPAVASPQVFGHPASQCIHHGVREAVQKDARACLVWVPSTAVSL